ncbi:hypothetical protein ACIPWL_01130 [Streptomyces sp. NPDC090023]|uniref:hypothetical protein n=1 Tax=unclassified Streptomyces TaxID=2593676 RepID=UPI00381A53DB
MNRFPRYAALVAAALAVSSCTAQAAPQASPSARTAVDGKSLTDRPTPKSWICEGGKFHWGHVSRRNTLVAVSEPHRAEIPAGKTETWSYRLTPLRALKSSVTPPGADKAVDAQAAVTSLEGVTGLELAKAGTTFTLTPEDETAVVKTYGKATGVIAAVVSVEAVEAPFVYGCGTGKEGGVRGTLTTWKPFTYSSMFKCGIDAELSQAEVDAEALICGQKDTR